MAGHTISVQRQILAEPELVWRVVTDIDRANKTLVAVEKVERIAGEGVEVGARWLETRRIMGKSETEEMWVEEVDEPRRLVIATESHGTRYRTVIDVKPSSMGTTLTFSFTAETQNSGMGQKMMFALIGKAGVKAAQSSLEADLADIARVAEKPIRR